MSLPNTYSTNLLIHTELSHSYGLVKLANTGYNVINPFILLILFTQFSNWITSIKLLFILPVNQSGRVYSNLYIKLFTKIHSNVSFHKDSPMKV